MRLFIGLVLVCLIDSLTALRFQVPEVHAEQGPRNVILVIGDGMGPSQIGLLSLYERYRGKASGVTHGIFEQLLRDGTLGLVQPKPPGALVVDSACAATELASGEEALSQSLGLSVAGKPVETISQRAKGMGKSVGIVSDTRITHATPAAFYARVPHRDDENSIAQQAVHSDLDVLMSGGLRHFLPQGTDSVEWCQRGHAELCAITAAAPRSVRRDEVNLLLEAKERGYALAFSRAQLSEIKTGKVLGLFSGSSMQSAFSEGTELGRLEPTLKEMTQAALSKLSENEQGFFLMVEAGQIDWAGHANDVGWLLKEMQRIGGVLELIADWMKGRSDTLLVVTADHETGSFGFSYHIDDLPSPVPFPGMPKGTFYQPTYNFVPDGVLSTIAQQRKPLRHILASANLLEPRGEKVTEDEVARLQRVVRDELGVSFSRTEAFHVLRVESNARRLKAHAGQVPSHVPRIDDFGAFYARPDERRTAALARVMSRYTGAIWGTGTHTSEPVTVLALGPGAERFQGLHTQAKVGGILKDLIGASTPPS